MIAHQAATLGHALQRRIVKEDELVVGGEAQVGLQRIGALGEREQERTERVLGFYQTGAAMGHDKRPADPLAFGAKGVPIHGATLPPL